MRKTDIKLAKYNKKAIQRKRRESKILSPPLKMHFYALLNKYTY